MRLLINLLNECFSLTPCWKFHIIQESTWEWVHLQICYDRTQKTVESSPEWNKTSLVDLYWEAGLITSDSERELEKWIRKDKEQQRVKGIAPDTNLIIPGFLTTFLRRIPVNPYDIVPVLVIFARSIQYEIHSMRPFTYPVNLSSDTECFFAEAVNKWPCLTKLWNFKSYKTINEQVAGLANKRGRIGIKGTYEVDALYRWAPVIIVKPSHVLHSPKVLEQTPFLNAVHDSLIRYEIDFIRQNTTLPVLFITNDKDQCKSAMQEGIEALHVKKPAYFTGIDGKAGESLDIEKVRSIILGLLTRSSAVRMTSKTGEYYLSWTWRGRNMDDVSEHVIRLVDDRGNIQTINP